MNGQNVRAAFTCLIGLVMGWCLHSFVCGCEPLPPAASAPTTSAERLTPSQAFPRAEADKLLKRVLAEAAKANPSDSRIAEIMSDLGASLYTDYGDSVRASSLAQQATVIWKRGHSPEYIHVATGLNNRGRLCHARGDREGAVSYYKEATAILNKTCSPTDPRLAVCLNNRARLHQEQGKYDKAGDEYEQALAICEAGRGPAHPELAALLGNYAAFLESMGKTTEGAEHRKRADAMGEKCGPPDPAMARVLTNLAGFYIDHRKYEEAEPLLKQALGIREEVLGPEHLYVAESLNGLALAYLNWPVNRCAAGEPLCKRALAIYESNLEPQHPCIMMTQNNLAFLYTGQGKRELAKPLFELVGKDMRRPTKSEKAAQPDEFPVMLMVADKPTK